MFRCCCLFVKWSWVPPKLILYCGSPSKWFVISNSICKNCNHHFFFPSRSSFFPRFLLMASAAFSQSPSLETLSHHVFAAPSISVSAIALTFLFPPLETLSPNLFSAHLTETHPSDLMDVTSFTDTSLGPHIYIRHPSYKTCNIIFPI